jgi:hypothetical protein
MRKNYEESIFGYNKVDRITLSNVNDQQTSIEDHLDTESGFHSGIWKAKYLR